MKTTKDLYHFFMGLILIWLAAAVLVSFIRGMQHSLRDDNACHPPWGIQVVIPGNLFCNDDETYKPKTKENKQ